MESKFVTTGADATPQTCDMLLYGAPGVGKTGTIAALVNAGHKVVLMTFEGNLGYLKSLIDPDKQHLLIIVDFRAGMYIADTVTSRSGIYKRFNDTVLSKKEIELIKLAELTDKDFLILDTQNSMNYYLQSYIASISADSTTKADGVYRNYQDWGKIKTKEYDIVNNLRTLTNTNLIVIAHEDQIFKNSVSASGVVNEEVKLVGNTKPKGCVKDQNIASLFSCVVVSYKDETNIRKLKLEQQGYVVKKGSCKLEDSYPIESGLLDIYSQLNNWA